MKKKGLSVKAAFCAAALSLLTLIVFLIYGAVYDYLDYMVALSLILGAACAAAYVFVDHKGVEFLNLAQVVAVSYGLGLFFLNSHPVWADRLNHIEMYGSRGTLVPVVIIMLMFIGAIVLGIISCFTGKEAA